MKENLQIFNLNWGQKMNLNRIILPVMFLSALSINSFAQSIPATGGLLIDDETYESIDTRPRNRSEILIKKADLSSMFPAPGFQGAQGSCTGWAVSYAARSYYNASSLGKKPSSPSEIYSPSFQYNMTATTPSSPPSCGGAYIYKVLDSLQNIGAVSLADAPYNAAFCAPDMSQNLTLRSKASLSKIPGYTRFPKQSFSSMAPFKEALQDGHPVIINVKVPKSWDGRQSTEIHRKLADNGLMPGSYHAMVMVGFDEDLQAVKLMNSWGQQWGDNGFIWVDYKVFGQLIVEAYTISDLTPPLKPIDKFKVLPIKIDTVEKPGAQRDKLKLLADQILQNYSSIHILEENFTPSGRLELAGYGCSDSVERAKSELNLTSDNIDASLRSDPWPACEIAGLLTQQVQPDTVSIEIETLSTNSRGVKIGSDKNKKAADPVLKLIDGDEIKISVNIPPSKPYLQMYWLQADKSVKEIYNGKLSPNDLGDFQLNIGGNEINTLTVQAPYGDEAILVFAGETESISYSLQEDEADLAFMDYLRQPNMADKSKLNSADVALQFLSISEK